MTEQRRTLIVVEKQAQERNIVPHWQACHPDDIVTIFYTPPMGSFRFYLPRDLPISSVPIIADPILERRPQGDMSPWGTSIFDGDFGAMARSADHIVCATDCDPAGCRNFLDLMSYYQVKTPLSEVSWLALRAEDPASVRAGIDKELRADHPDFIHMFASGQAQQYFDNLYLLNALPVFGRALRMAGIASDGNLGFLSKYTLQMLLLLDRLEPAPFTESSLFKLMVENPLSKKRSPLGSAISRPEVISWLFKSGCLEPQGEGKFRRYILSDRGRRLVCLMHKDCFDPHLGARIKDWGRTWPDSKKAIDRYARTFFGKQKRFLLARA